MKYIQKVAPFAAMAVGAVLALATSAFSKAPKDKSGDPTTYSFEYNPPSGDPDPYSISNVQNVANWQNTTSPDPCGGSDEACTLLNVPDTYVNGGSTPTLKSTINIVAQESSPNVAFVHSTAAGSSVTIKNQTE